MSAATAGFDCIIVGAGAAGCVLANRLSIDPHCRVALIEAGPSDRQFPINWKTMLPMGNIFLLPHARTNWQHEYTGGAGVHQRRIPCPRGKMLGGCTGVNGIVYMRGHRSDYDDWAALGNAGWGYGEVLPVFKQHENYAADMAPDMAPDMTPEQAAFHGRGGELDVERPAHKHPLAQGFVAAAVQAGHARNDDFNGAQQEGFGAFDLNRKRGVRWSSSRAFVHPVWGRPNLQVFTDTLVERIVLRGTRARGVVIHQNGQRRELQASSEIILTAGTVNSPQLLLLSGIGPAAALQGHGIAVAQDLPGVGANLQDHPTVSVAMTNPGAESYALTWRAAHRVALAPLQYLFNRSGMLASNAAEAGGFLRSTPDLARPDLQMTFMVGMKDKPRTLPRQHGFVLHVAVLRPHSRGTLELSSADPAAKPLMRPQFLEDSRDVALLMHGLHEARRIIQMPALARFAGDEVSPGPATRNDAQLETFVRQHVATTYHPVGTCKMGPDSDPMAVVDARLQVRGIEGLRVADAAIMPTLIGGNTSAPAMMIGERAAAFILQASR